MNIGGRVWTIHRLDSVESTNATAREMGEAGAPDRSAVLALEQTGGRGRLSRKWFSPRGGVWVSLILRPRAEAREFSKLTALSALAVVGAIREVSGVEASVKWPNDVLVGERKVCGILLELQCRDGRVSFVVVGIGVNLNLRLKDLPEEVHQTAATLAEILGRPVDEEQFIRALLANFEHRYVLFEGGRFVEIVSMWRDVLSTLGREVRVATPGEVLEGRAIGVGEDCSLVVRRPDGNTAVVVVGDCIHLRHS